MCLLVFNFGQHPDYSLIFGGNRDEFYDRPTASADWWEDAPHVFGGRDLKGGGTWMGGTERGYWGVVTNIRAPGSYNEDARSRGELVAQYLRREPAPLAYLRTVRQEADQYNPFNLLVGTTTSLYYVSSAEKGIRAVEPGLHGLSNHRLDSSWPKVQRARHKLQVILEQGRIAPDALLNLLHDRRKASREDLPDTGIGEVRERQLSPIFIEGNEYGTRASTVLLIRRDGTLTFVERTFDRGDPQLTRRLSLDVGDATADSSRAHRTAKESFDEE